MSGRQSKFLMWINYRIRVTLQDSRVLIGTFLAFDKHMNLVLSDTEEYSRIKAKNKKNDKERKRSLGLVLLRGDNIISISAESQISQSSKRFGDIQPTGNNSVNAPGKNVPVQAQSGLASIGRGVGVPNMMPPMMVPNNDGKVPTKDNSGNNMPLPPKIKPPSMPPTQKK